MSLLKKVLPICLLISFLSCQKEDSPPDSPGSNTAKPMGVFSIARAGVFQKQNGYNAEGTAELGSDEANVQWLHLASDFNASLSTGAVTVYLSKNQNLTLGVAGSFRRMDLVTMAGEHFYKIEPAVGDDFKFTILWCASAGVQFGNAELK
ncbi:MAG: hypothetical protein ACKVT2_19645 [Saprospiraceae bacterium]